MLVKIVSFGYENGVPEANLIFDVRFIDGNIIPKQLVDLSGLDDEISEIVAAQPETELFLDRVVSLLTSYIPLYDKMDITDELIIGVGCTHGRHRSVALASLLSQALKDSQAEYENYYSYDIEVENRDINNWEFRNGEPSELSDIERAELGIDDWADTIDILRDIEGLDQRYTDEL
jgi:RNase adaptor protein for sRNA GlmZ degradation